MLVAVMASVPLRAQGREATLRGINTVTVSIEPIPPAALAAGISDRAVLDNVHRVLRSGGIAIVESDADAQLAITINAIGIQTSSRSIRGIAFTVAVSAEQEVRLIRIPITSTLSTWRQAGIGVASGSKVKDALYAQLMEYLDAFIAAHHAANPR
jgi:hypothetical protein